MCFDVDGRVCIVTIAYINWHMAVLGLDVPALGMTRLAAQCWLTENGVNGRDW